MKVGSSPSTATPKNDEMLFVWEGEGSAYVDGVRHRVEPGSLVFVGRHRKHSFVNEGKGPLKLFFMITPGGLETLIRSVGRPREAGEAAPARFERAADELAGHETIKYGSIRDSYVFVIESLERQEVGLWTSGVSRCGFRRRAG